MKLGYDLAFWNEYSLKLPIEMILHTHIHLLLTGASGSGKSYALKYLIHSLLNDNTEIWMCDFKNSRDFEFLQKYVPYYIGEDCQKGIEEYYNMFQFVKENKTSINKRQILIIDEYPSLLLYMTGKDKKMSESLKLKIAEILMMGRSLSIGIWIIVQRADAAYFSNGVRENFMTCISLGKVSPQTKTMLYAGDELPNRTYQKGEGIIQMDGSDIREIKFPKYDTLELERSICKALRRNEVRA